MATNSANMDSARLGRREPIAIVGIGGRFPGGANSLDALWENLKSGTDLVGEWPADRWDPRYFHPDPERSGRIYTKAGGFLDQIDQFDADFFGMSPREASRLDPQQRLALELAWTALEDAGHSAKHLAGAKTAVFIGVSSCDYATLQASDLGTFNAYTNAGGALSIVANRVSFFFDFRGPSMSIDTACSSSMVAVHEACQSIWSGESDSALAGGVNLLIKPETFVGFCKASMLARDGRCKSFDASGDGYVRAEGGVVMVLKPLGAAQRDHDHIAGLIVATGVNSDGRTKGLALPSEEAQEALLRQIYSEAHIAPDDVFYIEAHGTGTVVGDPIECAAIGRVLGAPRADGSFCHIGSVKSNIGHLEPASGVAGIAKVLLALKHREIPANLHYHTPNPKIAFDELKLKVVADPLPIPQRDRPWLFGINSFGFGGTNAHVVIEEYDEKMHRAGLNGAASNGKHQTETDRSHLLLLSAHSDEALSAMASDYARFLRAPSAPSLDDVCATAGLRRSTFYQRLAVLGRSAEEIAMRLESFVAGEAPRALATGRAAPAKAPKLAFVFCGNGPQRWAMGRELYLMSPIFRQTVNAIDELFAPLAGWSIRRELNVTQPLSRMSQTEVAQPMLFALQAGIVAMLREMGVTPAATIGHSVGEIAAAYVAGALSLQDAVAVVYARSHLQARTAGQGKMAAVGLSPEALRPLIEKTPGWIEIAGINAPNSVTLSGEPAALESLGAELTRDNVFFRMLALDYAFHSHVMDPVRAPLVDELRSLAPRESSIPFVSTVTGQPLPGPALGADYWWRNVREPVQFSPALGTLIDDGFELFIEIGPHPVLRDYINQIAQAKGAETTAITTLRRPTAAQPELELEAVSTAICACYANGGADPKTIFHAPNALALLPSYPWQKQSFWTGRMPMVGGGADIGEQQHPLLGGRVAGAHPSWRATPDPDLPAYLRDHAVQGAIIYPAAAYMEMAIAGANLLHGDGPSELEDFAIYKPLIFADKKSCILESFVDEENGSFKITSRYEGAAGATVHVVGKIGRGLHPEPPPVDLDALRKKLTIVIDKATHYAAARARGLEYGETFQGVERLAVGVGEVLGDLRAPDSIRGDLAAHKIHPAILDSALQVLLGLVAVEASASAGAAYLPIQAAAFRLYGNGSEVEACHVIIKRRTPRSIVADFSLLAADGRVIGEIEGFRFQAIDFSRSASLSMFVDQWELDSSEQAALNAPSAPAPGTIAVNIAGEISRICAVLDRRTYYTSVRPKLEELAGAYAAEALTALGARDGFRSVDQLAEQGGVIPEYHRLLDRLLDMCRTRGYLQETPDGWRLDKAAHIPSSTALWQSIFRHYPGFVAESLLLARCGAHLVGILRGEISSLKLIFGETASGTLEQLYDSSPSFAFYNQIAAATLAELCAHWPADRPLRVLEIGAGTGGITAWLLPVFPAARTSYLFTDVSEALTGRAERRFSEFGFLRSATFDLEKDLASQGFSPESFDLIIASDALHVAADLRAALGRVNDLLAPDGLLLLLEKHREDWVDVVFGTLSGWWNFADLDLRPTSALLSPQAWRGVLADTGFGATAVLSDAEALPEETSAIPQQSLFLAQKRTAIKFAPLALEPKPAKNILLLADAHGPAADFAAAAEQAFLSGGDRVSRAKLLDHGAIPNGDGRAAVANDPEDMAALLESLRTDGFVPDQIVSLAGLAPIDPKVPKALAELQDRKCLAVINLIQALARYPLSGPSPRLTLVSLRAHPEPSSNALSDPAQAPVWGLARVIANEQRDLRCRLIDLHMPLERASAARLVEEIASDTNETEVLLTPHRRYVRRVQSTSVAELAASAPPPLSANHHDGAFRLEIGQQGNLDSLILVQAPRVAPGFGQVEVRIHAAGLNFRDVMWAMGLLPEEALEGGFAGPTIGMECAGEIERVGPGVKQFAPGDRVIAFGSSCFASHMVTDAAAVARIPAAISYEAAATIPTTFFTAYYSLEHLAHLEAGERILIHGAAGGVGLAAIQLAQRRGAEVFATAGTNEKRELLNMLGVDHVLDSRSLAFADEVMALTGGTGVDVVLNSLAGEAIWKNLRILRPFGRFIELGKRDFYANSKIGLRPFRNNLTYFGVDLDQMLLERKDLGQRMLNELMGLFATGELTPLPYRTFPIDRASEAFRLLQQSRHVGKLIIAAQGSRRPLRRAATQLPIHDDATYLVTGGLTGFGLATAQWLVANGARSLVLLGRRGRATDESEAVITAMESAGARVKVLAMDVTDEAAMTAMIGEIRQTMPPLRGVVHSAMVLDDGLLMNLDQERFHRALDPKILGAWLLHQLTLDDPLDFFILYSSAAAFVGNPGQGNYVSGCYYLEALADYRRSLGLPALSIGWGAISDVGYVARNTALREMMESRAALKTISSKQALAELGHLITAGATRATVAFDAQKFRKLAPSAGAPKFAGVLAKLDDGDTGIGTPSDFLDTIKALEPAQRRLAMVRRLTQMLSRIMGTSATQLPVDRSLSELGVDSLMAVEFGGAVEDGLGIKMPAMEALEGSITDIALQFLEMLGLKAEVSDGTSALESVQVADIEKMDEHEVDQLLEELTRETA